MQSFQLIIHNYVHIKHNMNMKVYSVTVYISDIVLILTLGYIYILAIIHMRHGGFEKSVSRVRIHVRSIAFTYVLIILFGKV